MKMKDLMTTVLFWTRLALAILFSLTAILGCLGFVSYLFGWDIFYNESEVFSDRSEGGASLSPVLVGLVAIAASCLFVRLRERSES
jgi:hypothetical protein